MTIAKAPLAIDGVLTPSSMIRKGIMAASGGGGVVGASDFKVSPNSPNGQSLLVGGGLALVPNGYQTSPDEVYVVPNPSSHLVPSGDMPGSSGSTTYWLVCLVVGDPTYTNTGHPFMPSSFDNAQLNTFQFNRIVVLPCSANTTSFSQLNKLYPGLALARLAIPPTTTTITAGMITDLRVLNSAAGKEVLVYKATGVANVNIPDYQVNIPGLVQTDVPIAGPLATYEVTVSADVTARNGCANFVDLFVDTVPQGGPIITSGGGADVRSCGSQTWYVTGLSAGPHSFIVQSHNYTGSTGVAIIGGDTTRMIIKRIS